MACRAVKSEQIFFRKSHALYVKRSAKTAHLTMSEHTTMMGHDIGLKLRHHLVFFYAQFASMGKVNLWLAPPIKHRCAKIQKQIQPSNWLLCHTFNSSSQPEWLEWLRLGQRFKLYPNMKLQVGKHANRINHVQQFTTYVVLILSARMDGSGLHLCGCWYDWRIVAFHSVQFHT